MKQFLADWRNPALVAAGVALLIMIAVTMQAVANSPGGRIVAVGDRNITEDELVKTMKNRFGDQLLTKMVSDAIVDNYARSKAIDVTDAEINQVLDFQRFQLQLRSTTLEDWLASQGMTLDDQKKDIRTQALLTKMLVPKEAIAAEVKKPEVRAQLSLPARYRYRIYSFNTPADANKASERLQGPDGGSDAAMKDVAGMTPNPAEAMKVLDYIPAFQEREMPPPVAKAFKELQAGQSSKAIPLAGATGPAVVIQLVEATPARVPSMENSDILIGQMLLEKDPSYRKKELDLEAKALQKVDVKFDREDYKRTHDRFEQEKKESPDIPILPTDGTAPAQPGVPTTTPAAPKPAPAAGKK